MVQVAIIIKYWVGGDCNVRRSIFGAGKYELSTLIAGMFLIEILEEHDELIT